MVSPSKVQHQEHKQLSRENKSDRRARIRTGCERKPLNKKSFYLDIKNHAVSSKLEARIKELGGTIEVFLVRSVNLVVTDRIEKVTQRNLEKRKWGCASGDSGGPPSLKSIEVPTPTPTPPTPFLSSECPLSNSTIPRGQPTQRSKSRVDAMLERALIQPQQCSIDPLDNAQNWGIPIWATDKLHAWLDRICVSIKEINSLEHLDKSKKQTSENNLTVKHLKGSFIKFEAYNRRTRPVFLELQSWPTINFDSELGVCPFDARKKDKFEYNIIKKEVKENREAAIVNKEKSKEMTRRPRTTASRARRSEQVAGYCEICRIDYRDLSKHVQSDQHLNFVRNDDNFLSLDTLINAGANVEAFLKLNKTKDIGNICNLFPNDDKNLHDIIPEDKNSKTPKSLNNFVGEMKMVQCNGARRNLDLKLSSSHNMRTRATHESGHLLRSKGSPWHEVDKSDKFYDKFEGFTIKKRAKGTIWIEKDDSNDKFVQLDVDATKGTDNELEVSSKNFKIFPCNDSIDRKPVNITNSVTRNVDTKEAIAFDDRNGLINFHVEQIHKNSSKAQKDSDRDVQNNIAERKSINLQLLENHTEIYMCKSSKNDSADKKHENHKPETKNSPNEATHIVEDSINQDNKFFESTRTEEKHLYCDRAKNNRVNRRGVRSMRGRQRLSVEERLIEDNRAYYKVEVLGNKLRSSVLPSSTVQNSPSQTVNNEEKKDPSSEKPVVVRFKRVRKSELSLLSDEAESFMFGEPRRDDSSELSDGDHSSVLPRETESDGREQSSMNVESSQISNCSIKQETMEEDSQDSVGLGRARKRRRTQAEAFIKDNTDYYKFETPGSRLRYQTPSTIIKDSCDCDVDRNNEKSDCAIHDETGEKIYPSKPSAMVEKLKFSFETIPKSEPWYQTYERQDKGAEFWHYFSEGDLRKPFLLPYEIENFYETVAKNQCRLDSKRRGRGRTLSYLSRSPRKSPRCHASTLAIMSTIIRKREQQHPPSVRVAEECEPVKHHTPILKEPKQEVKSDVDEELKEIVKTIDEMLSTQNGADLEVSFEPDDKSIIVENVSPPKGAPHNLLELLDNCHEMTNGFENSSCASSECGEIGTESPLKRRKKRKNRTGWPGNKMRRKLQSKPLIDMYCEKNVRNNGTDLNQVNQNIPIDTVKNRLGDEKRLKSNEIESNDSSVNNLQTSDCVCDDVKVDESKNDFKSSKNSLISDENHEDKEFSSGEDVALKENVVEIKDTLQNDQSNDENHENVFRNDCNTFAMSERQFNGKTSVKKRQRISNIPSDTCESHTTMENHDILCNKVTETVANKHLNSSSSSPKRQARDLSENPNSDLERRSGGYRKTGSSTKRRLNSRRRYNRRKITPNKIFDHENCKKESYISINCKKQQSLKNDRSSGTDGISSSGQEDCGEIDDPLTTTCTSPQPINSQSTMEQRRSGIDFQPVVRMMKIEDQMDREHSILSVTVASNRRLRSSSSPRSSVQSPRKRFKTGRGHFRRWLKNS